MQFLPAEAPRLNIANVKGRNTVVSRTAGLVFHRASIAYSMLVFLKGKRGTLKTRN